MNEKPTIIEVVTDPQLLNLSVSLAQGTLLKSFYGLPLTREERPIWHQCTGRSTYPGRPFREMTVLAGARGGKDSRILAPILVYEAVFGGHEQALSKGEHGIIPLVAQDQRATRIAFGYIKSYFTSSPLLRSYIEDLLTFEIKLINRLSVVCFPCTHASLRGWSNPCGGMDELAFYRLEGQADSDVEVQASIRRGMLSFSNPKLIKITTPYMKSGVVYADFKQYFGQEDAEVLVWRASSLLMNPSLKAERLAQEQRLDPSRYHREYEAEFADDLDSFLPASVVDACVVPHRHELPPMAGVSHLATCDTSGGGVGAGRDTFTFTIFHVDGAGEHRRFVQDLLKGWKGTCGQGADLGGIVKEIAAQLCRYGLNEVRGDKYAAGWVRQAFEREGVRYRDAEMDKSTAYLEAEPVFTQGRAELLDHAPLIRELTLLERRPRPQGRVLVDHPHGGHDDYANVTCLAIAALAQAQPQPFMFWSGGRSISSAAPVMARVATALQAAGETVNDLVATAVPALGKTGSPSRPAPVRRKSFEEMQNLMRSDLTPDEQERFDAELARRAKHRQPSLLEQAVRAGNIYWPSDGTNSASPGDLTSVLEEVRQRFAMWR